MKWKVRAEVFSPPNVEVGGVDAKSFQWRGIFQLRDPKPGTETGSLHSGYQVLFRPALDLKDTSTLIHMTRLLSMPWYSKPIHVLFLTLSTFDCDLSTCLMCGYSKTSLLRYNRGIVI